MANVDSSIPMSGRVNNIGGLLRQGVRDFKNDQQQDIQNQAQNRLTQLREDKFAQDESAEQQKSITKEFASVYQGQIAPLIQEGRMDEAKDMFRKRASVEGASQATWQDGLRMFEENPEQAINKFSQTIKQAQFDKLIPPKQKGGQINILVPGKEGIQGGVENSQGQIVDPITRKVIRGAIKAPARSQQETGPIGSLTKSQHGKTLKEHADAEVITEQNVESMEDLKKIITSDDFVGGVSGDVLQFINSGMAQFRQLTGVDSVTVNGEVDPSLFESKADLSAMRRAAINADVEESLVTELSFIIAKSLNPDGKISDADVRQAAVILGKGADKRARIEIINRLQKRIVRNNNIRVRAGNRNFGTNFPEFGGKDPSSPAPTTDREIEDKLLEDVDRMLAE